MKNVIILISKGRNLLKTLIYLKYYNIYICDNLYFSRKLFFKTNFKYLYILIIKNSDINFYINSGFVDFFFIGKDLFYEIKVNSFYRLYNLYIEKFNLSLISNRNTINNNSNLIIFTKYFNTVKIFFNFLNLNVDIIKINSSSELTLLTKNSNLVVDIVSSGKTVIINNLFVIFNLIELNNIILLNLKLIYKKFFLFSIKSIKLIFNVIY